MYSYLKHLLNYSNKVYVLILSKYSSKFTTVLPGTKYSNIVPAAENDAEVPENGVFLFTMMRRSGKRCRLLIIVPTCGKKP